MVAIGIGSVSLRIVQFRRAMGTIAPLVWYGRAPAPVPAPHCSQVRAPSTFRSGTCLVSHTLHTVAPCRTTCGVTCRRQIYMHHNATALCHATCTAHDATASPCHPTRSATAHAGTPAPCHYLLMPHVVPDGDWEAFPVNNVRRHHVTCGWQVLPISGLLAQPARDEGLYACNPTVRTSLLTLCCPLSGLLAAPCRASRWPRSGFLVALG